MNEGYGIHQIPMAKLEEYGKQDVKITKELYEGTNTSLLIIMLILI